MFFCSLTHLRLGVLHEHVGVFYATGQRSAFRIGPLLRYHALHHLVFRACIFLWADGKSVGHCIHDHRQHQTVHLQLSPCQSPVFVVTGNTKLFTSSSVHVSHLYSWSPATPNSAFTMQLSPCQSLYIWSPATPNSAFTLLLSPSQSRYSWRPVTPNSVLTLQLLWRQPNASN